MSKPQTLKDLFAQEFQLEDRMLGVYFYAAPGTPRPRSFLTLRAHITDALSTPFRAVVHGITPETWYVPDGSDSDDVPVNAHADRFLGVSAGLRVIADGRIYRLHGVVSGVRHLGDWFCQADDETFHAFELIIESPLRLLDLHKTSRIFVDRGVNEVVHDVMHEQCWTNQFLSQTFSGAYMGPNELKTRAATRTQYQETDLEFIQRQLVDAGLNYHVTPGFSRGRYIPGRPSDDALTSRFSVFAHNHDFGTTPDAVINTRPSRGELTLQEWHARRRIVPPYTIAGSHDYKANAYFEGRAETTPAVIGLIQARGKLGWNEALLPQAVQVPTSRMEQPAHIRQWAHELDAEVFHGKTTGPLTVGTLIQISGLSESRVQINACDDRYIVTAQTIIGTAPVSPEMMERLSQLASIVRGNEGIELFVPDDTADGPLSIRFEVQPNGKPLVAGHPSRAPRPLPGPVTATVVGHPGEIVTTDPLGRIAVNFHWERDPPGEKGINDHTKRTDFPGVRVRYVHPGAGKGMGTQCLPRAGDEVLIVFINHDPDRPIAVGSIHNGAMGTPSFGGVSTLPGDAALTGIRSGEHHGSGANEMVMDDTTAEVGLRLGTTHAATDLSLGHIATPRQDGKATQRGTGAELRTEGAAALRAAQGAMQVTDRLHVHGVSLIVRIFSIIKLMHHLLRFRWNVSGNFLH